MDSTTKSLIYFVWIPIGEKHVHRPRFKMRGETMDGAPMAPECFGPCRKNNEHGEHDNGWCIGFETHLNDTRHVVSDGHQERPT